MTTRRTFLTTSSLAAAATLGTPWRLHAEKWARLGLPDPPRPRGGHMGDPDFKALAKLALDGATAAGASYADVRFTLTRRMAVQKSAQDHKQVFPPSYSTEIAGAVRALVQGSWGFMADNDLTPDMMGWLGQTAAKYGKVCAWSNRRKIDLGERPPVASGHWEMPVKRDPFSVPWSEHKAILDTFVDTADQLKMTLAWIFNFERQERIFASTDGSFTTQTVYNTFGKAHHFGESSFFQSRTYGESGLGLGEKQPSGGGGSYGVPWVAPRGVGLEAYDTILKRLPEWAEEMRSTKNGKPLEVPGRFEVVFDGYAMARLVNTLGVALDVDRALGYEANSINGGTSYLSPVEKMLGTKQFPAGVTLTGNRTQVDGAATVQWDTEGVAAQEFPLVKDGMLVDYSTTREFAPELAAGYQTRGQTVQSRGCAGTESALYPPMVQTPNLQLHPGPRDLSVEELLVGIDRGIVFFGGDVIIDQQQLNARGWGTRAFWVNKGKLADAVPGACYMARMPDFWTSLVALGGERSAETRGFTVEKGEPGQYTSHSVRSVAGRFKNVSVRNGIG